MSSRCSARQVFGAVLVALAAVAAGLMLSGPVSASPVASASAKKCGDVTTAKRRQAKYVAAVRIPCRLARRLARRATGKTYSAFGFTCKPRPSKDLGGKLFGCGRVRDGKGQGVGFLLARK